MNLQDIVALQDAFVATMLSRIERHARWKTHGRPDRDDLVSEAVAQGWVEFLRLRARGVDPARFGGTFARHMTQRALVGHQIGTPYSRGDAMSRACLYKNGVRVRPVGDRVLLLDAARARAVRPPEPPDITRHPDWAPWRRRFLKSRNATARPLFVRFLRLAHRGYGLSEIARALRIAHGSVRSMARDIRASWAAFRRDPEGYLRGPIRVVPRPEHLRLVRA
jgi:hypothetical protein